jgi:glycosyltransferase involved in cell wall biosynthesis
MDVEILIISSVHRWDDTRIFYRQASSLSKYYKVELHAPANFLKKEINSVKIIGLPLWKKKIERVNLWWQLWKRILKSKAKVIHFHDPELIPLVFIIKIIKQIKVVYDVHEHIIYDIQSKTWIPEYLKKLILCIFILVEKICVPRFDAVIYTTPVVGKRYKKLAKRSVSIENYSKLDTFIETSVAVDKDDNTVLYLGRVLNMRGVDQVIKAFEYVIKKIPDAKFMIVGDIVPESYETTLKALAVELKMKTCIEFIGFVRHLETLRFLSLASCGIVVFRRGFANEACLPNKLFEYMASGLPVIASDFALYKEVINEFECGITVDPENVIKIAEGIIYMLKNPEMRKRMGINGKRAFETKYNWDKEEKKLLTLYRELLC